MGRGREGAEEGEMVGKGERGLDLDILDSEFLVTPVHAERV